MRKEAKVPLTFSSFSVIFLSFYLFLLFLVEDKFLLWVIPPLTLVYLGMICSQIWKGQYQKHQQKLPLFNVCCGIGVCLYLLALLLLSSFSLSIPLSVHRWISLALGGLTFTVFLTASDFNKKMLHAFLIGIVVIHLLFVPFNLFFLIYKNFAEILPTNSLLTFLVGQNHSYILYLYSLPIACYYWMKSGYKKIWGVVNILFIIGVLLSFSRFGLLLLMGELLLFTVWFFQQKKSEKTISVLLIGLLATIFSYGGILFIFSSLPSLSLGKNCQVPFFHNQLCKSFISDGRLVYWSQAWKGFLDHPVVGNGGGTFGLISTKYRKHIDQYSAFPHSEYLQFFTEYGVVGGVAVVVYGLLLVWIVRNWLKGSELAKVLFISIGIASVDAVINFNWNYSAIFVLHCLFVAVVLREMRESTSTVKPQQNFQYLKKSPQALTVLLLICFCSVLAPLWWLTGRYIVAEVFAQKNDQKYFQIFPYNQERARRVIVSTSVPSLREKAVQLYKADPEMYRVLLGQNFEPQRKYQLYQEYLQHDPLDLGARLKLISSAIHLDQPQVVLTNFQWLLQYYPAEQKYQIKTLDSLYLEKTIEYANQLAKKDPHLAADLTMTVYQFEPWRANDVRTTFLLEPEKYDAAEVEQIIEVLPKDIWRYKESLGNWAVNQAVTAATNDDWLSMTKYVELGLGFSDSKMWDLWQKLYPTFSNKLNRLSLKDPEQAAQRKEIIMFWRQALASIQKFDTVGLATQEWSKQIDAFVE